jgi:hypothetical protein
MLLLSSAFASSFCFMISFFVFCSLNS